MAALPRDIPDVYLAPVVLAVDARISELSGLDVEALAGHLPADRASQQRLPSLRRKLQGITALA